MNSWSIPNPHKANWRLLSHGSPMVYQWDTIQNTYEERRKIETTSGMGKKKHGLLGALKVKTQFEHRFRIVILIGRPTLGPFETPTSLFAIVAAAGSHLSAGRVGGSREVIFFLINVGGSNNCNCFRTASSTLDWWKITKLLFAERNSSCESWVCHKLKTEMLLSFCLTTSMIHLFTQRGRHASCWTTQASEVGDHICWQLRKFNHYGSV